MWSIVFSATVAVALSAAAVDAGLIYATAPQDRGQYHRGSGGSYNYGYNTGDGVAKVEVKRQDGSVVGSYRYFDPNGKQIVRSYVADSKGFRILGNDLPISPETPAANIIGAPALTAPVEGAHQAVVDASLHPTKRQNTIDIQHLTANPLLLHAYQRKLVLDQQNALLLQQQKLIEQQKQELAALRGQQDEAVLRNTHTTTTIEQPSPSEIVQYNTLRSNVIDDSAPYYYYPFRYNYDFPAGFAYNSGGVVTVETVEEPTVVGARHAELKPNRITVGRRRDLMPYFQPPIEVVRGNTEPYQRPYVIGRMK